MIDACNERCRWEKLGKNSTAAEYKMGILQAKRFTRLGSVELAKGVGRRRCTRLYKNTQNISQVLSGQLILMSPVDRYTTT